LSNVLDINVSFETINLISLLFSYEIERKSNINIDLNKMIDNINIHILEHGTEEDYIFDPKNNMLEIMVKQVKNEQLRCLDDLLTFNKKHNEFYKNYVITQNNVDELHDKFSKIENIVNRLNKI